MSIRTYLPLTFSVDKDYQSNKFIKLRMRICHEGKNPNGSDFYLTDLISKKDSLCESPILAHIYNDENDVPTIGGHDFVIEENKFDNSTDKIVYLEQPVGVIPQNNNFEITEQDGIHYVNVDGYIWRGYSNYCEEIINNYDELKISMEVDVLAYSYDAKENSFHISDFIYKAVTLLNEGMGTGMKNARASIENFSQNDATFETMQKELNDEFLLAKNTKEGEIELKLDEILKEYSLSLDELDFEITEDMSEDKVRELLDEFKAKRLTNSSTDANDDADEGNDDAGDADTSSSDDNSTDPATDGETSFESVIDTDEGAGDVTETGVESKIYKREISVNEKFRKIYDALDNAGVFGYVIDIYDSYFIYDECDVGTFKQYYHLDDNNDVIFEGEAIEVFPQFLTSDEVAALDELRANYSKVKAENDELVAYKAKVETDIRNSEVEKVFSEFEKDLGDFEEYQNLKNDCEKLSIEDIRMRCFAIKGMKVSSFSGSQKKSNPIIVGIDSGSNDCGDNEPYGGLFKKYKI